MFTNGNSGMEFAKFNGKTAMFVVVDKATSNKEEFSQVRDVTLENVFQGTDTYEGKTYKVLSLEVRDTDAGITRIRFAGVSAATAGLLARLLQSDLKQPFGLSGQLLKAGTVVSGFGPDPLMADYVSVSVFQEGSFIKLEEDQKPPRAVMVKVGKDKEVADTTLREEFIDEAVATLRSRLGLNLNTASESQGVCEPVEGGGVSPEDDIPF